MIPQRAKNCRDYTLLTFLVKLKENPPLSKRVSFCVYLRPVPACRQAGCLIYRISYVIITDAEIWFSPGVMFGAMGAAPALSIDSSILAYIG